MMSRSSYCVSDPSKVVVQESRIKVTSDKQGSDEGLKPQLQEDLPYSPSGPAVWSDAAFCVRVHKQLELVDVVVTRVYEREPQGCVPAWKSTYKKDHSQAVLERSGCSALRRRP